MLPLAALAGWEAAGKLLPVQGSSHLPLDQDAPGVWAVLGSTALFPPGGPGKRMGVMTKLFRLHVVSHQVPLKCIPENKGALVL